MRVRFFSSNALAMAMVFAVAGLSYAVSTAPQGALNTIELDAHGRAVGSGFPLRFTNPLVAPYPSGEYDLGDAAFGSVITRYITAEGGLRPYRFTSFGSQSLDNVLAGTRTTLQLGLSGVLAGSVPGAIGAATTTITGAPGLRFLVNVQDAEGTNPQSRTAFFNLFLVDSRKVFKFGTPAQLPDARLATSYLTKLEVVGGSPAYTFTVLSVSGPGVATQDQLGVYVTASGDVVGRPLASGTFTFVVRCQDARGRIAQNRAQTAADQAFTLNVNTNPVSSSDSVTLSCTVKGDRPSLGKDTLSYTGIINVLGQDNFSLVNSDFSFALGGVRVSGRLDKHASFKSTLADNSKVTVKISPNNGKLTVKITNGNFANGLNATAIADGSVRKPVQITVGDAIAASEILDFVASTTTSSYALNFSLGSTGVNDAGAFQIVSVHGKDGATQGGLPGDAWQAKFLAIPRLGVKDPSGQKAGLDAVTAATVRIGTNFIENFTGASINSSASSLSLTGNGLSGVRKLKLDVGSFKGSLTTTVLSNKMTTIPQAFKSPGFGAAFFSLGLDLTRGSAVPFSGEHARRIFGLKTQWRDALPKR